MVLWQPIPLNDSLTFQVCASNLAMSLSHIWVKHRNLLSKTSPEGYALCGQLLISLFLRECDPIQALSQVLFLPFGLLEFAFKTELEYLFLFTVFKKGSFPNSQVSLQLLS